MQTLAATSQRRRAWAAVLVFLFPLLSLVSAAGVGLCAMLFVLAQLALLRDGWSMLRRHWRATRPVLFAFATLLALEAARALALEPSALASALEKPLRMLLAVSAMLLVQVACPARQWQWLWRGASVAALAGAALAAWQRWGVGLERPGGVLNPITFGNFAACLALLSMAALVDARSLPRASLALGGALAGMAASLLSGSRGGWIILVLATAALCKVSRGRLGKLAFASTLLLLSACWLAPQTGVRQRLSDGAADISRYLGGDGTATSLSIRLELWKAGLMLARQHPWRGQSTAQYKAQMHRWVEQGRLGQAVFAAPEAPHLHNDALQVLVTRGLPGLAAWLATLLLPLRFFARQLAAAPDGSRGPALAGLLLVLAYASFGLSEVMFWSLKGSLFYALMVFLLMGASLNARAPRRRAALHLRAVSAVDEPVPAP
ncbi:MAG: O-antigen ligase family protein [Pseudomonadota bacterium]